jgi:hypothetical protein
MTDCRADVATSVAILRERTSRVRANFTEGTGLEPVRASLPGGFQDRCLTN